MADKKPEEQKPEAAKKYTVTKEFRDINSFATLYAVGDKIEIEDLDRVERLKEAGHIK